VIESPSEENRVDAARQATRGRKILAWALVACWGAVIWSLGEDQFSSIQTSRFLMPLLRWFVGEVDADTRYHVSMFVRKSAHLTEYGILALLTLRAAWIAAGRAQLAPSACIALFVVVAVASADEFRQTFSAVRTGSPYDVLIDLTGGLIAIVGVTVISKRMRSASPMRSSA
jgi:VanZ family protein